VTEREVLAAKRVYLELRARVLLSARAFFLEQGFLEVQTPLLASELAPEPHIEPVPAGESGFLITSPELYMKRLLAAGYRNIFQISPVFRRGERGRLHHPEFTLLEWYRAGADYNHLQGDCREFLAVICRTTGHWPGWSSRGQWLEVEGDWQVWTVSEAFRRFAGWDPGPEDDANRFDTDLVEKVEPHLGFPRPCILKDYPANQAALARLKPGDPPVAERFELYWGGIELANGYSELVDAQEQRLRFEAVLKMHCPLSYRPIPLPETFLDCMGDLPPSAGIALGIDRLVMLMAGAESLDEVVAFPPA
jgi:elongation factor P--(R)-beta-lysine ligase